MPHEYDDPITPEAVEAAASLACELSRKSPTVGMEDHVAVAVSQTFCGCATSIEDSIEGGLSGLHAAVLQMVAARSSELGSSDRVDEASAESFPASDPPAWIHRPS